MRRVFYLSQSLTLAKFVGSLSLMTIALTPETITPEQLGSKLGHLPENPRVVVSGNFSVPWTTLKAFHECNEKFILNILHAPGGVVMHDGVTPESSFVGPGLRKCENLRYVPSRLSMVPLLFLKGKLPVDAVIANISTPVNGKVSLGAEVNIMVGAIEACKRRGGIVIGQVNRHMPYTFGDGEFDVNDFDILVEADDELGHSAPWDDHKGGHGSPMIKNDKIDPEASADAIADNVARRIESGMYLQMGIGDIPDRVLARCMRLRNMKIWTEMFSDGVLGLERNGVLDPGFRIVSSFINGSRELMDWVHLNDRVRIMRTETVNNPGNIMKNPGQVSINTALQIDVRDRANAARVGSKIISGFGGSTDFIVGSQHSPGGQSIMALRSWHPKIDQSTIVPRIESPVTSSMHTAVITENGVAEITGATQDEKAWNLINKAAHPAARDWLTEEAKNEGLKV